MKWSTFKLRFKRAVVCSWKDHEFSRVDQDGHVVPLFFCDRCGALKPDIYYPALDKRLEGQGLILERAPFEHDKFGTYTIASEKKFLDKDLEVANTIMSVINQREKDRKGEVWDTIHRKFIKHELDDKQ